MDEVAEAAGVAKMILYRFFGSKDALVHAVLSDVVDDVIEADAIEVDWWTDRIPLTLCSARGKSDAFLLLVRHASHDAEYGTHYERLFGVIRDRTLARNAEAFRPLVEGEFDPPVSAAFLAESVTSLFLDAYGRWLETGDPQRDEAFVRWICRSVEALTYYWARGEGGRFPALRSAEESPASRRSASGRDTLS